MEEKKLQQEMGFDSSNISEKSKEALQSETWQKAREAMKAETDAPVEGGEATTAEESSDVAADQIEDFKEKACKKLQREKEKAKYKQFSDPVIGYLLKRCEEDNSMAQDVMQEHKTWEKCFDYIYEQARKQAKNARCAAVCDDVVYEWAEDYYHKDDKAEEDKKAKKAAERKKKEAEGKKFTEKNKPKEAAKEKGNEAEKAAEVPKPKKNPKEIDGQMDLFSMLGV